MYIISNTYIYLYKQIYLYSTYNSCLYTFAAPLIIHLSSSSAMRCCDMSSTFDISAIVVLTFSQWKYEMRHVNNMHICILIYGGLYFLAAVRLRKKKTIIKWKNCKWSKTCGISWKVEQQIQNNKETLCSSTMQQR